MLQIQVRKNAILNGFPNYTVTIIAFEVVVRSLFVCPALFLLPTLSHHRWIAKPTWKIPTAWFMEIPSEWVMNISNVLGNNIRNIIQKTAYNHQPNTNLSITSPLMASMPYDA